MLFNAVYNTAATLKVAGTQPPTKLWWYKEALERENERLDRFVQVVSHDLRNPLNVAMRRLELVRDACEDEHVRAVDRALDRMRRLIDDLLVLARQGESVDARE